MLFLTTNRAGNIDPAVRSRITVALRYNALDRAGREEVWRNLLRLSSPRERDRKAWLTVGATVCKA